MDIIVYISVCVLTIIIFKLCQYTYMMYRIHQIREYMHISVSTIYMYACMFVYVYICTSTTYCSFRAKVLQTPETYKKYNLTSQEFKYYFIAP